MRSTALLGLALTLVAAGCGGGGHTKVVVVGHPHDVSNPGLDMVGSWTGTFTDQYGDYTASLRIDADNVVPSGSPGTAFVVWGAESIGLEMRNGELRETGEARYHFVYDTVDPANGAYQDTVSGELSFTGPGLVEGTFSTTSGTSGQVSFARNASVPQELLAGHYSMSFSDASSREVFYLGEIEIDRFGNVIPGPFSYLTDDLSGPIDPGANVWPILDGAVTVRDADAGIFEGTLYFESADDTISLSGYLGTDLGIYAGIFEDVLGPGLFTFYPVDG